MRRFTVTYCSGQYECVQFSDGDIYIHGSSIVPPEFPDLDTFLGFLDRYDKNARNTMKWLDDGVE